MVDHFQPPEWASGLSQPLTYQEYFFPGVAVLIVMFTAIFSTISIIEDRREGFLQGVLAAPVPRSVIVSGKGTGRDSAGRCSGEHFSTGWPAAQLCRTESWTADRVESAASYSGRRCFLTLIAVELTGLGFLIAWPMNSTQGFHAIMSVFLMPMWLLSGAFFPGGGEDWLSWIIRLNPLTYGVAGLRRLLYSGTLPVTDSLPSMSACVGVTVGF